MVNGIHFIGVDRSSLCEKVEDCEEFQSQEETKKERNKPLLIMHRQSKALHTKGKRITRSHNHHFLPRKLQPIKEEEATGATEVDLGKTLDVSGQEDVPASGRCREVELILNRKFKSYGRVRRDKRQVQRKAAKVTSPQRFIGLDCWDDVVQIFAYAIQLYSCSAARYAMFRLNRSLKPGD